MLNGFDPLSVPTMSWIKNVMAGFPRGGEEQARAVARARKLLEIQQGLG